MGNRGKMPEGKEKLFDAIEEVEENRKGGQAEGEKAKIKVP